MAKTIKKVEKGMNRHWKNFIDKNYLGSHNIEKDEQMLLTIEKFVGEEEVATQDGKKKMRVLYFKENVPKMIMNITNGDVMEKMYGSHPDGWIGKQIFIHAAKIKAFGKTQDALRIRDVKPSAEVGAIDGYITKLQTATNLNELKTAFSSLPRSAQENKEVVAVKDELKTKFK